MKPKIIGSLLFAATIMLSGASLLEAAPDTLTQSVSYGGETITLQLKKENLRGAHFEVLVQNSSGGYDAYTPAEERSYLGTVDEYPGAVACGIQMDDGTFKGAVYFDRGGTWFTQGSSVTDTRGLEYSSNFADFQYPSAPSVSAGQAGSTTYAYDLGVDVDYGYYSGPGSSSVAKTFELIEYGISVDRALYMRDAMLRPYLGRVIIRADQIQDPYAGLGGAAYLNALKDHWNANHTAANSDLVAGISPGKVGGGLGWVGVVGASNGYSVSDSGSEGYFGVIFRHEMGHNWGCNHSVGGSPEGKGIMGGNLPARFTGCELNDIFAHRDNRISVGGIVDNEGTYTAVNLPPYAALDPVTMEIEAGKVEPVTIDVLANDFDANGHSFTLSSYQTTSSLGYPITVSVGTGANGQDELIYSALGGSDFDYFSYTIEDSSGQTATGYVVINSIPVTPRLWTIGTDADTYVQGNSSTTFGSVDNLFLKNSGPGNPYTRVGWVHFNISGKTIGDVASLGFTVDIESSSAGYIDVWGIVDGASGDHLGTDWTEGGLNYNNAPANPDFVEGAQLTYLGSFDANSIASGGSCGLSSATIASFLKADTNGEVTFLLLREQGLGTNFSLRTKEHASGGGPTLSTSFSTGEYLGTDTYVRDGYYANDNYGSETEMAVKKDGSSYQREAYLRFNHTSASNAGYKKTLLTLTALEVQPGQSYRIRLVDDTGDGWDEAGLAYNNRPVGSGAGITFYADDMTVGTPYTIDVTELFNQVGNANGAATFHIDALTQIANGFTRFATRENATAAYRPAFKIVNMDLHDAYVRNGYYANTNYGADPELVLKNDGVSYYREVFLKSSYEGNGGEPVAAASLTLTPTSLTSSRDIRLRLLDDANDDWIEDDITYNNRPPASGNEIVFSSSLLTVNQPYTIDVTSVLNQAMNSNDVASFLVDLPGSTGPAHFTIASKEHPTAAYRPVLNVNPNAPVANDGTVSIDTDTPAGSTVIKVAASDLDAGDNLSYAITAGNGSGQFAINGSTGKITTTGSVVEGQYVLTVMVTDSGVPTLSDTAQITIDVSPAGGSSNSPPVANDASGSVAEDAAIGTSVTTVTSTDPDAGDSRTYAITAGNTGGAFAIDSNTGEVTTATALDYETVSSYSLTVTVTDGGGLIDNATVTITVTDVNENPAVVSYTSNAEAMIDGAIISGSMLDTQTSNNVYEVFQEAKTSGKPASRVSSLEHTWSFDIGAGGILVELSVEAFHSANNEGDHFVFSYSTDGINFTDLITVTKTSDDNTAQLAPLPAGVSGTVYIRVVDTDRRVGNGGQDTLSIDQLTLEVIQ